MSAAIPLATVMLDSNPLPSTPDPHRLPDLGQLRLHLPVPIQRDRCTPPLLLLSIGHEGLALALAVPPNPVHQLDRLDRCVGTMKKHKQLPKLDRIYARIMKRRGHRRSVPGYRTPRPEFGERAGATAIAPLPKHKYARHRREHESDRASTFEPGVSTNRSGAPVAAAGLPPQAQRSRAGSPPRMAPSRLSRSRRRCCSFSIKAPARRPALLRRGAIGRRITRGDRRSVVFRKLKERRTQRRIERRATKPHCRRGKHTWRTRGRGDALTYVCEVCGETSAEPPRSKWSGSQAPYDKAAGGGGSVGS